MKIVFAGTKNGRDYVYELLKEQEVKGIRERIFVSTATQYGASLYEPNENLCVVSGKMDLEAMQEFFVREGITQIIDSTHPYAVNVTENLKESAKNLGISYVQIARDSTLEKLETALDDSDPNSEKETPEGLFIFETYGEICDYLSEREGAVLLTIGSNNLQAFAELNKKKRVYVRVLPTSEVLKKCEDLGFSPANIIALQGPFSQEMNQAMYRDYGICYLVTKDSGSTGGTVQKILPALEMGIQVLMLKRP